MGSRKRRLGSGRQRGLSLLEVLVVVVVIGILAALTLPVFSRARARAIQAVCQNHLKQISVAVQLYLQYNDNTYFPHEVETDEGTLYYYGLERLLPDGEGVSLDVTRGYLFSYYSLVSGVGSCPAFKATSREGTRQKGATLGFGYNRFGVAGRKATCIANPENIVLFADCAHVVSEGGPLVRARGRFVVEEWDYVSPSEFTIHFRHAGQANVLFCDGHVESREPRKILSVLPKAQVGMINDLGDTALFIP
ncbi:MAG TPA: prepilin-type N-terminal cleavage/methylation domain-containing protein [Planctomycetota bacterium]|nr:prepilin-type N-terminal cleavage/methylation domain-containing protein [Planctomycetota bacterium]